MIDKSKRKETTLAQTPTEANRRRRPVGSFRLALVNSVRDEAPQLLGGCKVEPQLLFKL